MAVELYVWFEADPAMDDAVRAAFMVLRRRMAAEPHKRLLGTPRLLRRADLRQRPAGARATWMEIWRLNEGSALDVFSADLEREAGRVGLTHLAQGGRQIEVFIPENGAPRPQADR